MNYTTVDPAPFAHQLQGIRRLIETQGKLALLCDPGTGKSRIVVDYLGMLASCNQGEVKVLLLCPKSVKDSWIKEFQKWMGPGVGFYVEVLQGTIPEKCSRIATGLPGLPEHDGVTAIRTGDGRSIRVAILNHEALSSRRARRGSSSLDSDKILAAVKKFSPHVLVADECHRLRSPSGNAARLAARISLTVPKRLLLTGTPMPHSPMDVWGQWRILEPAVFSTPLPNGNRRPWPFSQFQDRYAIMGGFAGKQVMGFQRLDELEDRMEPNSFVVHKQDCLDLPPVTEIDLPVALSHNETKAYRTMKRDLLLALSTGDQMTSPNKLSQMMRLRQISCGFVTTDSGEKVEIGTSRLDACMDLLEDLLASESRVVVFAWSRWECDRLADRISGSKALYGAKAALITGDTSDVERLNVRNSFGTQGTDKQVLIAQSRTISLGVNELTTACYGIFLSLTQQRDDLIQGIARLDRQGQTRPVSLYFLVGAGTIDEVILGSHRDRTDLETSVMNHLKGT